MAETSRGQPHLRGWPRGPTLVALLGVLLVGGGIYVVQSLPRFEASPGGGVGSGSDVGQLSAAVQAVFAEDSCPSASQASRAVRRILTDLGYSDWSVNSVSGGTPDGCVGAAIAADTHQVILIPALSLAVRLALDQLRDTSYDNCLTERQVADMLTATLTESGQTDFNIRTDGPLVAPTDRFEEVQNHVLSGCWVYSTTALSGDGNRIFFLVGRPNGS